MNKQEWQYSTSMFRELLSKLNEGNFQRRVKYRFGLQFNPMFGFYHLWDGLGYDLEHGEPLTVATIKLRPKTTTVRLLPEYLFKNELSKFKLPDRKTILIESGNVSRHDGWVHNRIHSRVERRIQRGGEASELIQRITHYGGSFVNGMVLSFDELEESYRTFRLDHDRNQVMRRAEEQYVRQRSGGLQNTMRSSTGFNDYQQTYFGRPMEQVQEALNGMITEGTSVNESTIISAVDRLDELNVPRDDSYNRETLRRLINRDI